MRQCDRVLEILYDRRGGWCAAQELSSAAGVAGARLAAVLGQLAQRGHVIQSSPHGLRLLAPVRLDAHLIERHLGVRRVGRNIICFDEVDSTSDVAFDAARQSGADGLAVLAESQRSGRGRHGRQWISPPAVNLLMSVLLIDPHARLAHEALTVGAGLAVAEGVQDLCGLECRLKWPNDVQLDGRKLCGVLVEVRRRGGHRCVVVGIGVNANASPPPSAVDQPAISLAEELGEHVERIELARAVLRRLDMWVRRIAQGELAPLRDEWVARCGMIDQRATIMSGQRRYEGRILDVSPLEGLILRCDTGQTVHLPAEASTVLVCRR